MKIWLFFLALLMGVNSYSFGSSIPQFEDFTVSTEPGSVLEKIDFTSHEIAPMFRTRLSSLVGKPADFAGHYIITTPGCGTGCQMVLIVDVRNGQVYQPTTSSAGTCYSSTSELLIVNPFITEGYGEQLPDWAATHFYRFHEGELKLLQETKQSFSYHCESGQ